MPACQFLIGWFPFSVFETDGSDVSGLGFIKVGQPGKFQFELDQLEIK
jgi:hypothetical protein